jgi:hypothetical protein
MDLALRWKLDPNETKAVLRAAYHEAGHVVAAVRTSVRIGRLGMCIDDCGRGYSAMRLHRADDSADYPVSREISIAILYAGSISEARFDHESTGATAAHDCMRIQELRVKEPLLTDLVTLERESRGLVERNWGAIDQLARRLLLQPYRDRGEWGNEWNTSPQWVRARQLSGEEIAAVLPCLNVQLEKTGLIM